MRSIGIRELRDKLSRVVRQAQCGDRIQVTSHGRVIAELGPPSGTPQSSHYDALIATGVVRPAINPRLPLEDWPDVALAPGTAADQINIDRGEP